jgi:hypothetical protein
MLDGGEILEVTRVPDARPPATRPWRSLGLALSLGAPSIAKLERLAGAGAALVYAAGLVALLSFAPLRRLASAPFDARGERRARLVAAALIVLVLALFLVVHPRVTGGSDRDEALDTAVRELLHGRHPYRLGALATGAPASASTPISPMPGELLLAVPFVLLGTGALQTFAWLAAFYAVSAQVLGSERRGLVALVISVALAPAVVHEIVTGGDLLANALWVLAFVHVTLTARRAAVARTGALLLGVGLASRLHFAVVVPLAAVAILRRRGAREATLRTGLTLGALAAASLPWYLADPGAFSPLHVHDKLRALDAGPLAETVVTAAVMGAIVTTAWLARREATEARLLGACATALGVPVGVAVVLASLQAGRVDLASYGWYALGSLPFGVLASMAPPSRARARARARRDA